MNELKIENEYAFWLKNCADDEELYGELTAIAADGAEKLDRFYRALEFGTGGLRGILGAGTNRMNVFTVGRATFGLARYLRRVYADGASVAIAYDSRNKSDIFARRAAEILSSCGVKAYLFDYLTPTPVLSFAVRYLHASAGIVVTASHNPKAYNGYKVYNEHGCQITDDAAKEILGEIESCDYFTPFTPNEELIAPIGDEVVNAFLSEIEGLRLRTPSAADMPKVVYTPLHGTGNVPVREILRRMGCSVEVVKEQELPDGEFTTCPYPNPEEKETLQLALRLAENTGAELVLATDPDTDRIGIAVRKKDGAFVLLNGNETGVLLMDYMLAAKAENGTLGEHATVIKTVVTTDMAFGIAAKYGATVKEVLTGFKYIGESMDGIDNYVMGLEESYGYLVGKHARDKDAVSAAMLIVEMCAYYKAQGKNLYDILQDLYAEHGYYITDLISKTYQGADGKQKMTDVMNEIRTSQNCGYAADFAVTDFALGVDGLPKSNVVRFRNDDMRIIFRPSGTEPKLKLYLQVKGETKAAAEAALAEVRKAVETRLS